MNTNTKTCSFFGHRNFKPTEPIRIKLENVIENLILTKNVQIFIFGSMSQFDDFCFEIVTTLQKKYPHIQKIKNNCKNECATLKDATKYTKYTWRSTSENGFDDELFDKSVCIAGKASYIIRNYLSIDLSDYCIFYYNATYLPPKRKYSNKSITDYQPQSGTKLAYEYAKKKHKDIILINN